VRHVFACLVTRCGFRKHSIMCMHESFEGANVSKILVFEEGTCLGLARTLHTYIYGVYKGAFSREVIKYTVIMTGSYMVYMYGSGQSIHVG